MKETEMDWRNAQRVKGLPHKPDLGLIPSTRARIHNSSSEMKWGRTELEAHGLASLEHTCSKTKKDRPPPPQTRWGSVKRLSS